MGRKQQDLTFDQSYMKWDAALVEGQRVEARWTSSGGVYRVPATIKRVNRASVRVVIERDVPSQHAECRPAYLKGREIVCPRPVGVGWTNNNCLAPPTPRVCEECGKDDSPDGDECGECANCRVPLCVHGAPIEKRARYDLTCDLWGVPGAVEELEQYAAAHPKEPA